jgi:GNAT superfamily N-acetyltransferase
MKDDYDHVLMVRNLTDHSVTESLQAPSGYYWSTYRPGYETHWNEVQHAVFNDKPRDFLEKYKESDYTVFLPGQFFFVFEQRSGEPVGINTAQVLRRSEGYLANLDYLGVKESHRGVGLGELLVELVERRFRENGFSKAGLRSADVPSRESARSLYKRMGWTIVDKGEPDRMFEKQNEFIEEPDHPLDLAEEELFRE